MQCILTDSTHNMTAKHDCKAKRAKQANGMQAGKQAKMQDSAVTVITFLSFVTTPQFQRLARTKEQQRSNNNNKSQL